jgi:hypothetical protein
MDVGKGREHDCRDAGGRQKTAPAFSAFTTSLWLSNAGSSCRGAEALPVRKQGLRAPYFIKYSSLDFAGSGYVCNRTDGSWLQV